MRKELFLGTDYQSVNAFGIIDHFERGGAIAAATKRLNHWLTCPEGDRSALIASLGRRYLTQGAQRNRSDATAKPGRYD